MYIRRNSEIRVPILGIRFVSTVFGCRADAFIAPIRFSKYLFRSRNNSMEIRITRNLSFH